MKAISEFLLVAAAFAVSACSNKNVEPECPVVPESGLLPNQFAAGTAATKMAIDSEWKLSWEQSDRVSVYDGSSSVEFHPTVFGGSKTVLEAEGFEADGSKTYYAVYPASAVKEFSGSSVTIEIDRDRSASAGAFPSAPAVGSTAGDVRSFDFANVCGLVSFNITEDDIASVVLFGGAGEDIAGTVTVNASTGVLSNVADGGEESIMLTPASGSAFAAGRYYVAVLPQTFASGMSISLYKTDGSRVRRNINAFTLGASSHVDLDDVDDGRTWKTSYTIKNADELQAFLAVADCLGDTAVVSLANDIDLTGVTLTPAESFAGTFDGAGHSLVNWEATTAIFKTVSGTVKDLTIAASCSMKIPTDDDCAFIALENSGTIENCVNRASMSVSGVSFTNDVPRSVGAIAAVSTGTVSRCDNHGTILLKPNNVSIASSSAGYFKGEQFVGGIVGQVALGSAKAVISGCHNYGNVSYTASEKIGSRTNMGGIVGGTPATSSSPWDPVDNVDITNCVNDGDVLYRYHDNGQTGWINVTSIAGVAGYVEGTVTGSTNNGKVTIDTPVYANAEETTENKYLRCSKVGGVAGVVSMSISGCTNNGDIDFAANISNGATTEYVGSVINPALGGVVAEGPVSGAVSDCHNSGNIQITATKVVGAGPTFNVGGVMGYGKCAVSQCDNSGRIEGSIYASTTQVGGVVGYTKNTVSDCNNLLGGAITLTTHKQQNSSAMAPNFLRAGGVLGYNDKGSGTIIDNCTNSAPLSFDTEVVNTSYYGGVAGYANNGITQNCTNYSTGTLYVKGGVTGAVYYVGGVSGTSKRPSSEGSPAITLCSNEADVEVASRSGDSAFEGATVRIGGVTGMTYNGQSTSCSNSGDVSANIKAVTTNLQIAGCVGYQHAQAIISCTNSGKVTVNTAQTDNVQVAGVCANVANGITTCSNLAGGDVEVTVDDDAKTARVAGVAGNVSTAAATSCKNEASLVKYTGGTGAGWTEVGGLFGRIADIDTQASESAPNSNSADVEVTSGAQLRVGGVAGCCTKTLKYPQNSGDVTVIATGAIEQVGGISGYSVSIINTGSSTGNVTLTRSAGSSAISLCGAGLVCGFFAGGSVISKMTVSGTLTLNDNDAAGVPCGIATGFINATTLNLGASGAPFTMDVSTGVNLRGTVITSGNYNDETLLVGNKNGKTLNLVNIAYK